MLNLTQWPTWGASVGVCAAGSVAATAGAMVWGLVSPRSSFWGPVRFRGPADGPPRVALTFDDGPHPQSTPEILDLLADLRIQATFFVIGRNAQRWPDLLRRIDADGHVIGNHTYDHHWLGTRRHCRYWDRQFALTDELVHSIIGRRPAIFRPPMGFKVGYMMNSAGRAGHSVVTWTRRAMDGIHTDPRRIVQRLVPRARPGDILALHDGVEPGSAGDRAPTVAAIRPLAQGLRQRGLEPVRLDELLAIPAYAPLDVVDEEPQTASSFTAPHCRRFAGFAGGLEEELAADTRR